MAEDIYVPGKIEGKDRQYTVRTVGGQPRILIKALAQGQPDEDLTDRLEPAGALLWFTRWRDAVDKPQEERLAAYNRIAGEGRGPRDLEQALAARQAPVDLLQLLLPEITLGGYTYSIAAVQLGDAPVTNIAYVRDKTFCWAIFDLSGEKGFYDQETRQRLEPALQLWLSWHSLNMMPFGRDEEQIQYLQLYAGMILAAEAMRAEGWQRSASTLLGAMLDINPKDVRVLEKMCELDLPADIRQELEARMAELKQPAGDKK